MMGVCEDLRQAFNNCDVPEILHLLKTSEDATNLNFRDEAHGLQSLLMRLCHLHVSPEERREITGCLLAAPRPRHPDINAVDIAGRTALCHSCIAERTDMIAALSQEPTCDPNVADKDGNTPLIYAVKSRRAEVVEALIDCFMPRGLNVNHCNKKGVCALAEAEQHCDGAICRLLLHKAHADPAVLEQVQLPRDVRLWKIPRSPTPEMLATTVVSPRKKSMKRNTEILSPLVAAAATRQKSNLTSSSLCSFQEETDNDLENLSDVEEHEDEGKELARYVNGYRSLGNHNKKSSNSLPDLRVQGAVSLVQSKKRCPGLPLSHSSPSFQSDSMYQRSERRMTHPSLDDLALPQLSEEEEEEDVDEDLSHVEQKRAESLSLPHLSHLLPHKRVAVTKKANGAYVTYAKHLDYRLNGAESPERRLQLPQLNLSSQSQLSKVNGSVNRKGFQGNHAKKKKLKSPTAS